jgi:hypothetical protein
MKQEVADTITAILDDRGWRQWDGQNVLPDSVIEKTMQSGPVCLGIATQIALGIKIDNDARPENTEAMAIMYGLEEVILGLYRDRINAFDSIVPEFNDHKDTTEEDVRLVIKHAVTED